MTKNRFLDDQEKIDFYANLKGIDLKKYPYPSIMKVYKGAEFLLYHMSVEDLVFDTVLTCTGFAVTDQGMTITLMDRKNFEVFDLGDVPQKVARLDILAYTPPRCLIERTVKVDFKGGTQEGMTATAVFRSKSDPGRYKPWDQQVISLTKAKHTFATGVFERATAAAAAGGL